MSTLELKSSSLSLSIMSASLFAHIACLGLVQFIPKASPKPVYNKVTVQVVEKPIPPPPAEEAKKPEPEPAKPEKKAAATPLPKASPKSPAAAEPTTPPPAPVMGLSKDSFQEGGAGNFSAPAGNTTMMKDDGRRLSPEEIQKLDRDLSEDAKLIISSFVKPQFTAEAEDAGLEGSFGVSVFVDAEGKVTEVELKKKIGYGMDQRLIDAIRQARFSPRKNPVGQALSGWVDIKIRLELE